MKLFNRLAWTALFLIFVWALAVLAQAEDDARTYHPLTIAQMVAEDPAHWHKMRTHVMVEGWVTYKKLEGDGDRHLRVCDSPAVAGMDRKHCIVGEIIPRSNVAEPKLGAHVSLRGISRFDAEHPNHNWWEVHPVESLEVLRGPREAAAPQVGVEP